MSRSTVAALLVAAGLLGTPSRGAAQEDPPYTLDAVADAVASGFGPRILEAARERCVSFLVDAYARRRLLVAGADPGFIASLGEVCYRGSALAVTTEPAGASVSVEGGPAGAAPWTVPVSDRENATVEVGQGEAKVRFTLDVPPGKLVLVHVPVPQDTLPVPSAVSGQELSALRAELARLNVGEPRPVPPAPPVKERSLGRIALTGLAGAAAGALSGALLCRTDVVRREFDPVTNTNKIVGTGTRTTGGCLAASVGVGAAAGGLLGNVLVQRRYQAQRRTYAADARDYPGQVTRWEERRRRAAVLLEQLRAAEARDRIVAENRRIRERNHALPAPTIRIEDARRLPRAAVSEP